MFYTEYQEDDLEHCQAKDHCQCGDAVVKKVNAVVKTAKAGES
jgi:hypothetical protein